MATQRLRDQFLFPELTAEVHVHGLFVTGKSWTLNIVFSLDVMAAILVSQNNETAAMLVSQTNPLGVELFSYANAFFCSNKFA